MRCQNQHFGVNNSHNPSPGCLEWSQSMNSTRLCILSNQDVGFLSLGKLGHPTEETVTVASRGVVILAPQIEILNFPKHYPTKKENKKHPQAKELMSRGLTNTSVQSNSVHFIGTIYQVRRWDRDAQKHNNIRPQHTFYQLL